MKAKFGALSPLPSANTVVFADAPLGGPRGTGSAVFPDRGHLEV